MIDELATEFDTEKRGELAVNLQTILDDNALCVLLVPPDEHDLQSTVTGQSPTPVTTIRSPIWISTADRRYFSFAVSLK